MKVYTTELIDGEVVLNTYPSMKAFRAENKWCDPKFLNVATTKDLETYEFANERSMIVYTEDQKKSQMMLREIYLAEVKQS